MSLIKRDWFHELGNIHSTAPEAVAARWRLLDGAHLLPLVRAGIAFVDGVQPEGKVTKPRARAA